MAHLVRPWITTYVLDGKRVPPGTPGARRKKRRARKWYGCGIPGYPSRKRVPLASDKTAAQQLLAQLVRRAERGEADLHDSVTSARKVPLAQHLDDFVQHLRNKPKAPSDKQVRLLLSRLRAVFSGCAFVYPSDLSAERALDYLADRRRLPVEEGGLSIQTSNFYLGTLSQFCRWMASAKPPRLKDNPFIGIEKGNVDLDRRHDRRNLTALELGELLDATRQSERGYRGLTGEDRYWLYLTSCSTGFRAAELSTLTPESFALDAQPPVVVVGAKENKKKRPVVQPLPAFLAEGLRPYLADKPKGEPVWPGTWWERAATMLRDDLAAAGIAYIVQGPDGPLYADFHALRHSFITFLEQSGASPNTAKELARHSDIRLTLDRYCHANLTSLAEAVQRLPLPGNRAAEQENASLTHEQLTALAVTLGAVVIALFAPRLAPLFAPEGGKQEQPDRVDGGCVVNEDVA
jgi:integrase